MSSLKAAYVNELYKISKKKKITVAAILSLLSVVITGIVVLSVKNFAGINLAGSSEFSILTLSFLNYTIIPLFTAFVVIDMFSGEFGTGAAIKLTLTRPVSRFKVYLSKVLASATFIIANLLFVMVLSIVISFFATGSSMSLFRIFAAYVSAFFPLAVFALMVMFIANFTHGSASTFLISIIVFLALNVIQIIFASYQSFFFTSAFDWYTLFIGSYINFQKIFRTFLILTGSGIMLFAAGYYLFERRDI